jgi:hypothetical protein
MSVIVVATAFPAPEHRAEVVKSFEVLAAHPAGTARQGTL